MGWRDDPERNSPLDVQCGRTRLDQRLRGLRPIAVLSGLDRHLHPGRRLASDRRSGARPQPLSILAPLSDHGIRPQDITDVIFSHHHPDHTVNAALFPDAHIHDHRAIYRNDTLQLRPAEGFELSSSIRFIETPGHTPQDITTLVGTADGTVALTHLWWNEHGPAEDPRASDSAALHAGRARVLDIAARIIPGHGAPFVPVSSTPR